MRILLCLTVLVFGGVVYASDGSIVFIKGDAKVNGKTVKKGDRVSYGDKVDSGASSLVVVKVKPGTILKLKANTSIEIEKPVISKNQQNYSYVVKLGEAFIKAKKTKTNRFNIKTRSSVLGIRGTQFFVAVPRSEKAKTWMCVNEGIVSVKVNNIKGERLVRAGQGVAIDDKSLPEVKEYEWTKDLNWKMEGKLSEIEDKTDLSKIKYDLKNFDYE